MYRRLWFYNTIYLKQLVFLILTLVSVSSTFKIFQGVTKSYEVHVESNSLGTNVHYNYPMSKVNSSSSAVHDWSVNNNDAKMESFLSPVYATVSIQHPKMNVKGPVAGFPGKVLKGYDVLFRKRMNLSDKPQKLISPLFTKIFSKVWWKEFACALQEVVWWVFDRAFFTKNRIFCTSYNFTSHEMNYGGSWLSCLVSYLAYYKIARVLRTLWLDEPHFLSEYRDTADVIFNSY